MGKRRSVLLEASGVGPLFHKFSCSCLQLEVEPSVLRTPISALMSTSTFCPGFPSKLWRYLSRSCNFRLRELSSSVSRSRCRVAALRPLADNHHGTPACFLRGHIRGYRNGRWQSFPGSSIHCTARQPVTSSGRSLRKLGRELLGPTSRSESNLTRLDPHVMVFLTLLPACLNKLQCGLLNPGPQPQAQTACQKRKQFTSIALHTSFAPQMCRLGCS